MYFYQWFQIIFNNEFQCNVTMILCDHYQCFRVRHDNDFWFNVPTIPPTNDFSPILTPFSRFQIVGTERQNSLERCPLGKNRW